MTSSAASQPVQWSESIANDRALIDAAEDRVLKELETRGYPEAARFAIRLALEEAVSNAFRHGHKNLPDDVPVTMEVRADDDGIEIVVEDAGPGFDPSSVPDPRLDENLELPSGRGMLLMRSYMADVSYEGRGNRVRLRYRQEPDDGPSPEA